MTIEASRRGCPSCGSRCEREGCPVCLGKLECYACAQGIDLVRYRIAAARSALTKVSEELSKIPHFGLALEAKALADKAGDLGARVEALYHLLSQEARA